MKVLTEQQIIGLAKEFFQCEEGPEIGDVVVTDDLIKDFASELLALQREEEEINTAWSFNDVLKKLIWATDYLLHVKDYDGHNHEELLVCLKEAQKYIINNPLQGKPTKDIPLDMCAIEKWAEAQSIGDIAFNEGCEHGAKSMQSGEIARWVKENEG